MKDIPVFSTENGVASLVLKQIPYTGAAYILIQDTLEADKLLDECISFCRMAGAESVFAANHPCLQEYPFHTALWKMSRPRDGLKDTDAALFPVTEQTADKWRELYNQRMAEIPNFSYMSESDCKELLKKGNGYFVHRQGVLLGIGIAAGDRIDTVVSVCSGAGETVVLALNQALSGDTVTLEVASVNERAVRLYKRMGFITVQELSRWHQVF